MRIMLKESEVNQIVNVVNKLNNPLVTSWYHKLFMERRDDVFIDNQHRVAFIDVNLKKPLEFIEKNTKTINKYLMKGIKPSDIDKIMILSRSNKKLRAK